MDTLRTSIERVTQSGALACAPRELALARANYDFALTELKNGNATRAQRHIALAEQNVGAAQVLTPDRGCQSVRDEMPAIPSSSTRSRSQAQTRLLVDAEADGGRNNATFPAGAVKDTDARSLTFSFCRQTDTANATLASQMPKVEWSCRSTDLRTLPETQRLKAARLTAHVYGETRLDEAIAMSSVVLSIGDFEL
jgi:hypothetical protein